MQPSRSRLPAKKIIAYPQSVVLSSEPVLKKEPENRSGKVDSNESQRIHTQANTPVSEATTARGTHSAASATAISNANGFNAESALDTQQYTYVTDDSGYAWLYDNTHGQYYYYDNAQGTYIPYIQQNAEGSNLYAGSQPHVSTLDTADPAGPNANTGHDGEMRPGKPHNKRRIVRKAGGQVWEDATLDDWPTNDYRLFAGDLGPEVTGEMLQQAFSKFRTLQKTHVVMDKKTGKSRGYGFLSFGDADDFLAAWKEFNGKYVGSRPIKLRKSTWKDRNADIRKVKRLDKRAFLEFKQGRK
ncbi:hypothetical protein IWW48_002649 [Coemansia sp. RSA 1200]|nr:hypothetical protein IWW48_002649 [Coemansia sp. RSA 1200]